MSDNEQLLNDVERLLKKPPYNYTYLGMYRIHFIKWFKQHINSFDDDKQIRELISVTFKYVQSDNDFIKVISTPKRLDKKTTKISVTRTQLIAKLTDVRKILEEKLWANRTPESIQLLSLIEKFKENPNMLIPIPNDASNNQDEIKECLKKYKLSTKAKKAFNEAINRARQDQINSYNNEPQYTSEEMKALNNPL